MLVKRDEVIDSPPMQLYKNKKENTISYHSIETRLHATVADRDAGQDRTRGTVAERDQEGMDALVFPLAAVLRVGHIQLCPHNTHDRCVSGSSNPVLKCEKYNKVMVSDQKRRLAVCSGFIVNNESPPPHLLSSGAGSVDNITSLLSIPVRFGFDASSVTTMSQL